MLSNNENKSTSIARQINIDFWFKRLFGVVFFDIVLVGLATATYLYNIGHLPTNDEFNIMWSYIDKPAKVMIIIEIAYLFFAMFNTRKIRRKLKPLNDLAVKTEQISRINFDSDKMKNLEMAINNVSVDSNDISVSTGDKDLASIEIALNTLLKKMKESEILKIRFVSDASHELRTPIAVIAGYVNMLDRWGKEDTEVLSESIEALKTETDHMQELVDQLLFLARGDSGRNHLNVTTLDLSEIMKEVFEESIMIDDKHKYEYMADGDCIISGDTAMIKQSARIFIQNAARYSNVGDTIKIYATGTTDEVSFSIQDEGIGMKNEDLSHIFERFYRSDEARNSASGGSGLGLSIAKWIVDAHQGTIDVVSRPEFGTRFTVHFPKNI